MVITWANANLSFDRTRTNLSEVESTSVVLHSQYSFTLSLISLQIYQKARTEPINGHGQVSTHIALSGMKLLIYAITSTAI